MDGAIATGFISIGVVLVLNLTVVAYSYGQHTQKLNDLCRRVGRIESLLNSTKSANPREEAR